jgi:hypothetical protein
MDYSKGFGSPSNVLAVAIHGAVVVMTRCPERKAISFKLHAASKEEQPQRR